jgi:hypothetical protein
VDPVRLVALEREWRAPVRGRFGLEFRRWRVLEPALARFDTPDRLIAFLRERKASASSKD